MSKTAPLSALGTLQDLMPAKGQGVPVPEAATAAVPPPAPIAAPAPASIPVLMQPRTRAARVQLAFRIDADRHEQLRRISLELGGLPAQTILERLLFEWMDSHDAQQGRGVI